MSISENTQSISEIETGSSRPPKFWILAKLYELCESCHRNPVFIFQFHLYFSATFVLHFPASCA